MLSLTKLLCNKPASGDYLRYSSSGHKKPIVVWNITRRCNLKCIHCYSDSKNKKYPEELTTIEAKKIIDNLASYGIPVLLFSGGEPLIRDDIFSLAKYAKVRGLRTVLSTNGTLIDNKIKDSGFSYVGISIDGIDSNNDKFRGVKGAFTSAIRGIRNCKNNGIKVGLRFTITKHNYHDIKRIFEIINEEKIDRACFYHLVYTGRGSDMKGDDLSPQEKKDIIDYLCSETVKTNAEILTVDNHTDSVYLYKKINPVRSRTRTQASATSNGVKTKELLKLNGGNSSGIGIACIDNMGEVHPDQFWTFNSLGNVRKNKFSEIWTNMKNPILAALRGDRKKYLKGKCRRCGYFDICNGNFRVRAYNVYGDIWAEDPACYLEEHELQT